MLTTRVIPSLLLKGTGLVKTQQFTSPIYLGDAINTARLFNDMEVDEMCILNIDATPKRTPPNLDLLKQLAEECFMPLSYGGGLTSVESALSILKVGFEKVLFNTCAVEAPEVITRTAMAAGSQSVVVSIDCKKTFTGKYRVYTHGGRSKTKLSPTEMARRAQELGAGELFLNAIHKDGTMQGYDLNLIKAVTSEVDIPVIACGGASSLRDMGRAVREAGASAPAAGALFTLHGPRKAVLVSYPSRHEILEEFHPELV